MAGPPVLGAGLTIHSSRTPLRGIGLVQALGAHCMSDKIRILVFRTGVALLLFGGVLACWAFSRFDDLPNYQRVLIPLPFFLAHPMLSVNAYRNWESLKDVDRLRALLALILPAIFIAGSIIWLVSAPDARA